MRKILIKLMDKLSKDFMAYAKTDNLPLCIDAYNFYCDNLLKGDGHIYDIRKPQDKKFLNSQGISCNILNTNKYFVVYYSSSAFYMFNNVEIIAQLEKKAFDVAENIILSPYAPQNRELYHRLVVKQYEVY